MGRNKRKKEREREREGSFYPIMSKNLLMPMMRTVLTLKCSEGIRQERNQMKANGSDVDSDALWISLGVSFPSLLPLILPDRCVCHCCIPFSISL